MQPPATASETPAPPPPPPPAPAPAPEAPRDALGALWDATQGLRALACEDAVRRLWEQHERRAAAHPRGAAAPQAPVFVLPPSAAVDDVLVDNVITRSIVPSRSLTQETADSLRRRLQDTRHKTAGVIFSRCVAQANGYRGVNYFYVPHHTDFPAETQRRFSIIHSDERRVLEAFAYFTQARQDTDTIPRSSRAIFGVDSTLLQNERNFDVLMRELDAMPEPPLLFVFEGATPLPGAIRQRAARRGAWAFWDALVRTLRVAGRLCEMQGEPQPAKQIMLMQQIESDVRALIRLALAGSPAPARFVQRIPFALCGAQCLLVVDGSRQDGTIAALSPAYAAWRAEQSKSTKAADTTAQQPKAQQPTAQQPAAQQPTAQQPTAQQPAGTGTTPYYAVWEAPAELVATLPLFPLTVCVLQDAAPATLTAALDELYARKRWSVAIYPLQGAEVTPFAAVGFARAVVDYITGTRGGRGGATAFARDAADDAHPHPTRVLGSIRDAVLTRTRRVPYTAMPYTPPTHPRDGLVCNKTACTRSCTHQTLSYTRAAAETAPPRPQQASGAVAQPHFLLCDEEDVAEQWLAAAGVKGAPFLDDFLAHALFTLDAVYAIMSELEGAK